MLNDKIKIKQFKKKIKNKSQHVLTFKTSDFGHELENNTIKNNKAKI